MRKCEFCGKQISKSDIFCKSCGNKVNELDEVKDAIIDEGHVRKENSTFILVIIVTLLLVIVSFGLYYLLFK